VTPASNAFVPAVEGIIAGGEVVKDLLRMGAEETE
jgi:hesA/moeB/thiF family protein